MHSASWELTDSAVSTMNFKPSFRVFQHELYTNNNILWSSLRTTGMPILANDIQAAPLFPLTLLLSGLNENVFWNVFVIARIVLMGLGTYLLIRRFFNFQRLPAIFFILSFIYALYVMRWMNNPWQNGLLAGIWYLYFLCLVSVQDNRYTIKRLAVFLGLVLSVYSMVTNGFPEAAVMSAILVVLTYVPLIFSRAIKKKIAWKSYLQDLILAHIAGFALSSYQIFSIIELLSLSKSHRYVGMRQYAGSDLLPFFAENLTRFQNTAPTLFSDSRTLLGLIPVTFFLVGIGLTIKHIRRIGYGEIGAILCGVFIIFKMFAIGPAWFNTIVAKPPVLRESYFYVYFFSIFLWFFAYFSAKGLQAFLNSTKDADNTRGDKLQWRIGMMVIPLTVFTILWFAAPLVTEKPLWELLIVEKQILLFKVLALFFLSILVIHLYLSCSPNTFLKKSLAISLVVFAIIEIGVTFPKKFLTLQTKEDGQLEHILAALEKRNVPLTESRIIDRNGTYVTQGLSTIDTGATPLLPLRIRMFRTNFFKTVRAGHLPIDRPKSKFSWGLTSTNIKSLDRYYGGGEAEFPQWASLQRLQGGDIHFDIFKYNGKKIDKKSSIEIKGGFKDFFYFRGWAVGSKEKGLEDSSVYLVFKNGAKEIVVPTRRGVRHDVARHLGDNRFVMAGWDSYISSTVLDEGTYTLAIRFVDTRNKGYYEHIPKTVIAFEKVDEQVENTFLFGINGEEKDFLGVLGQYYIYLDKTALPRAYIASKCQGFDDVKDVVQTFRTTETFQLGNVFLEELREEEKKFCGAYKADVARVPILQDRGKELLLEKVKGPAIVVVNDNLYPGWQAIDTVKGVSLEIKPANITFRSLILPENREYQIIFTYRPQWLLLARFLVLLGMCILFVPVVQGIRNPAPPIKQQ